MRRLLCVLCVSLLAGATAQAAVYDIGTATTATFASGDTLTNTNGLTSWDSTSQLNLNEGSDLSNVDFTALGITSWTGTFHTATKTIWDGANLSGLNLTFTNFNQLQNDSFVGTDFSGATLNFNHNQPFLDAGGGGLNLSNANFSGVTYNNTYDGAILGFKSYIGSANTILAGADFSNSTWVSPGSGGGTFDIGPGTTSTADMHLAANFAGADFSGFTAGAQSVVIANLGRFDGGTAIGAKYDVGTLIASDWTRTELDSAGWQMIAGDTPARIYVLTEKSADGSPPSFSTNDLAQTQYLSSEATGANQVATEHAQLFNGVIGNEDGGTSDSGEVTMTSANTLTVVLDTSVNTFGYDITGIDSIFGWGSAGGGRSNQGYSIELGFINGSSATLVTAAHWEPNSPSFYWTKVSFVSGDGDALNSSTLVTNGVSVAGTGVIATRVKSITFDITEDANPGGVVVGREFDIFGTPTPIIGTIFGVY